jgi:hypothetical protein
VRVIQLIKSNEFFYLLKIFETNGFIGNGHFSTIYDPKGSGVGKKLKDFKRF